MTTESAPAKRHAAVVYNPIKVDLARLEKLVADSELAADWGPTLWLETTEADAGQGMTRHALNAGASVVLAAGGDGTVRAVAEALRATGVPLALLPAGTGNLLARNLELPLSNHTELVSTAFTGNDRVLDLGIAAIVRDDGSRHEYAFLVMAGLGVDAQMIAHTRPQLKKIFGWLAYVDAVGRVIPKLKALHLRYSLDGGPEQRVTAHTVIVGNCGALPGGLQLIPDAQPDDGILDIAVLQPRGPFGWVKVWNSVTLHNGVLTKTALGRSVSKGLPKSRGVRYFRGRDLRVSLAEPEGFQIDGEHVGETTSVHIWVDPGALIVRVPT